MAEVELSRLAREGDESDIKSFAQDDRRSWRGRAKPEDRRQGS
jgi:hypothetical protein